MKKIIIVLIGFVVIIFGVLYLHEDDSVYVKFNNETYIVSNLYTYNKIDENFKEVNISEVETTSSLKNDCFVYSDPSQPEFIYVKVQDNQYFQLNTKKYDKQEHTAYAPMVYVNNHLYFQRDDVKKEELPNDYQNIGTLDFYHATVPKVHLSTNQLELLGIKVYSSSLQMDYIYIEEDGQFIQWQIEQ